MGLSSAGPSIVFHLSTDIFCWTVRIYDSGATIPNADCGRSPVFDILTFGQGGAQAYDSRKSPSDVKPSIAVILLEPVTS